MIVEITSLTNAKVKQWNKYKEKKYREKDQQFLIEGEHLVQEAHKAHLLHTILIRKGVKYPKNLPYPVYEVCDEVMDKLSFHVSKEKVMGICNYPKWEKKQSNKIILLDGVQDPGNVGTIIRSAYSFGYEHVYLSYTCADAYNDKVIRSTQGALFHLPVERVDLKELIINLKEEGCKVIATSLKEACSLQKVDHVSRFALVFGNEGSGVSEEILQLSDQNVKIEMERFESLNVAVAAGICMYTMNQK